MDAIKLSHDEVSEDLLMKDALREYPRQAAHRGLLDLMQVQIASGDQPSASASVAEARGLAEGRGADKVKRLLANPAGTDCSSWRLVRKLRNEAKFSGYEEHVKTNGIREDFLPGVWIGEGMNPSILSV